MALTLKHSPSKLSWRTQKLFDQLLEWPPTREMSLDTIRKYFTYFNEEVSDPYIREKNLRVLLDTIQELIDQHMLILEPLNQTRPESPRYRINPSLKGSRHVG